MLNQTICFYVSVFDTIAVMEIQEFWNTYSGGLEPADFVWRFGKGDASSGVQEFIRTRPAMFGILCNSSWKNTFSKPEQYNRERVAAALLTYLELNREDWEGQVEEYIKADAEARVAERKRAEAEALAAAVARVEAEAKAKAGEPPGTYVQNEDAPPEPTHPDQSTVTNHDTSQERPQSDADAIAAAMARVEAEARGETVPDSPETERAPHYTNKLPPQQPEPFRSAFVPEVAPDHGLAQARTQEDAEAIAAAMARIEAEAREKAGNTTQNTDSAADAQPEPMQGVSETAGGHSATEPLTEGELNDDAPSMHSPPGSSPNP